MHVGEQVGKNLSISIENPNVLNISSCTNIPLMYSWYLPNVLNIPRCTHDIPPDVFMVFPRCTPDIPQCTHDIPPLPPMYSWYRPDVLNIPRCTEHTLYRVNREQEKLIPYTWKDKTSQTGFLYWFGMAYCK